MVLFAEKYCKSTRYLKGWLPYNLERIPLPLPGHTLDHMAYYNDEMLFCGDTLFSAGCGRVFEGTSEQMLNSLNKLKKLKAETKVYCGHEYTLNNIRFAMTVEPDNKELQEYLHVAREQREKKLPTLPSTIGLELAVNPFLRTERPQIKAAVEKHCQRELNNEIEIFAELRLWKNNFIS
jgi:hydroxyacylglutathione hydrolase